MVTRVIQELMWNHHSHATQEHNGNSLVEINTQSFATSRYIFEENYILPPNSKIVGPQTLFIHHDIDQMKFARFYNMIFLIYNKNGI